MAQVHIVCGAVVDRGLSGPTLPVMKSVPKAAVTTTSTGASSQPNIAGTAGLFWRVKPRGGDVWVAFGVNPTAAEGAGFLVSDGETLDLAVSNGGEKIAIKDA